MMYKYIRNLVGNARLRVKMFINYILLCIIPLAIISILNYSVSVTNTKEILTDFINLFSSQLNSEIEGYVSSIDNVSKTIINDSSILKFLSSEDKYLLSERITNRSVIYNYLNNMSLQKPDVKNIIIIGLTKIVYTSSNNELLLDGNKLENEAWYKKIMKSNGKLIITPIDKDLNGNATDTSLFMIGRTLKDVYGQTHGIITFIIKLDNIINTNIMQSNIITDYDIGIEVANDRGEYIYKSSSESLKNVKNSISDNAIVITNHPSKYGLVISIITPKAKLFHKTIVFRNFTIIFILIIFILTILLSLLLSHTITKPLSRLAKSMKNFQQGQYGNIPNTDRNDEIGLLASAYSFMITKINVLINEVYVSKLKERQAQFTALQHQINPHMLYNTIENIRMRAALNDDPEVSEMIKDLGKIFQLTLAKGKENHTIADEIEYIITYINLMNIRHNNLYKLEINISDDIREVSIIRFIFQPIIENSIIHGFKNILANCVITIDGALVREGVLLHISDNGTGIENERLNSIKQRLKECSDPFGETKSGIGLQNVYDRIKLEYGDNYFIDIQSYNMKGTTVDILIPFRKG